MRLCLDHHHLLALMAPRPFLLIGGQYDSVTAWQYLCARILNPSVCQSTRLMSTCRKAVRPIYQLLGADDERLAFHNHATGHRPPASANRIAYEWLRRVTEPMTAKL